MKKKIIALFLVLTVLLVACANHIQEPEETTKEIRTQQTTHTRATMPSETFCPSYLATEVWPEWGPCPEGGPGGYFNRFRQNFYALSSFHFAELAGRTEFRTWNRSRTVEEYHNVHIAVGMVQYFDISREDFERAQEEARLSLEGRGHFSIDSPGFELYSTALIFSFDNERINEFFLWENSIFAHEVGLPNPLRGEWTDDGWVDHPNWTENPAWRDHPFWPYLPFGDISDSTSVVWDSYAEFRAANP